MKRAIVTLVAVSLVAGSLSACAEALEDEHKLLAAVARTEDLSRAFEYSVEEEGLELTVEGEIRDAFRYGGTLKKSGVDVAEQIIQDDALGIRVLNPAEIPELAGGTAATAQVIVSALSSGTWVVDPSGAPAIKEDTGGVTTGQADPIQDSIKVLRYVGLAIEQAAAVGLWLEKDTDPAYRPHEDPFPPADVAAKELRYDLVRQPIPRPSVTEGQGTGTDNPVRAAMFRKMAVYVREGRVIRVLEEIDIQGHRDFVDARRRKRQTMLELLARIEAGQGIEGRLVERKMATRFFSFGREFDMSLPADAPKTNLKNLLTLPGTTGTEAEPEELEELEQQAQPPAAP